MNSSVLLVQRQLDAYNNKDVDGWLSTYAHDARQFKLHGVCIANGHSDMRKNIEARFKEPDLHARLLHRTVMNNIVVDHEVITRNFPQGKGEIEMLCIYEIYQGLIQAASFSIGEPRLYERENF
jgi:hypothetical protein